MTPNHTPVAEKGKERKRQSESERESEDEGSMLEMRGEGFTIDD
jgi:hypothetical protein